jgi:hypothetical protein
VQKAAESAVNIESVSTYKDSIPNKTHGAVHIIPILSSIYSQAAPKPKTHKDKLSPSQILTRVDVLLSPWFDWSTKTVRVADSNIIAYRLQKYNGFVSYRHQRRLKMYRT